MWREIYAPFGLVPAAAGNTGVQMAGWFNKEINTVADLKGLKMRIPGLGGEVLRRAGGVPVSLPGGEIFSSLKSGAIDATEWVGPYNDLAFGLYKAAKYYYYPGWHEPGAVLETLINRDALTALPGRLQALVMNACRVANQDLLADLTAKNNDALEILVTRYKVALRKLPDAVLIQLREISRQAVEEAAGSSEDSRKVHAALTAFRDKVSKWHDISERAYLNARAL